MSVRLEYRKLSNGDLSPRLIITKNGKRSRERIDIKIHKNDPQHKEKIAACEALKSRREFQLFSSRHQIHVDTHLSINKVIEKYVDDMTIPSKRKYKAMKTQASDFFTGSIDNLTKLECQRFLDHLYTSFASNTANSYYAAFSRVMQYCVEESILISNPARGVKKKRSLNLTHKDIITFDEFNLLLTKPPENKNVIKAAILSFYSGIGLSEIKKLKPENIRGNTLHYARSKTKIPVRVELKPFVVDMMELPLELPSDTAINKSLKNWSKRVKLGKHITFYCFRHSFAVNLLLNDTNIKLVKDLMGHTEIETTMKYLYFVELLKEQPTLKLPDLNVDDVF